MENICKVISPFNCNICNKDTLFFHCSNGMLIDYKKLFENGITSYQLKKYLQNKNVRTIKCIHCNKEFIIDWRSSYPIQLIDVSLLKSFGF